MPTADDGEVNEGPPPEPGIHPDTKTQIYTGLRELRITSRNAARDKVNSYLAEHAAEGEEPVVISNAGELTEELGQYVLGRIGVEKLAAAEGEESQDGDAQDQAGEESQGTLDEEDGQ